MRPGACGGHNRRGNRRRPWGDDSDTSITATAVTRTFTIVVGAAGQKRAVGPHPLVPFALVLMTDQVSERRRAVALARHYRDHEGLAIAEIARRLGRAEGTVKAYL